MAKSYSLSGSFNPNELKMLVGIYGDVCHGVEEKGSIVLTARVREAIAIAVFNLATAGERDPQRLRRRATQEVEAYGGVQRTLDRIVKLAPSAPSSDSRSDAGSGRSIRNQGQLPGFKPQSSRKEAGHG